MTKSRETGEVLNTRGTAATKDTGLLTGQVPTADDLSMVGETINYTGANLNPNVFGCNDSDARINQGFAASSSVALFYFPIQMPSKPTSITVNNTFSVKDAAGGTVSGGLAITPTLDNLSSFKTALLVVSGLTVTVGDILQLTSTSSASKITVNQ